VVCETVVDYTVEHTAQRKAFGKAIGKAIGDFQNTRFKLAELVTEAVVGGRQALKRYFEIT